jgi:hypothetical protein
MEIVAALFLYAGETFEKRPLLPNLGVRLKLESSKYLRVFLCLEFSPSLTLNKIEHFQRSRWYSSDQVKKL